VDEVERERDGAVEQGDGMRKEATEAGGEVNCEDKDEGSEKCIRPSNFPFTKSEKRSKDMQKGVVRKGI
jgi:hypothetical protein